VSYLFFIDESGNDRKQMPYEIHGGILVPMSRAWSLIRAIKDAELRLFGVELAALDIEIKWERLLQKRAFKFAAGRNENSPDGAPSTLSDAERRTAANGFIQKGFEELRAKAAGNPLTLSRTAAEFQCYGLACLELADMLLRLCLDFGVTVFAVAVPPDAPRPPAPQWEEMLRKDLVCLYERLFYFAEERPVGEMVASVFDQKDDLSSPRCVEGRRLNDSLTRYFTRSHRGRVRATRILPEPLYARSDLTTLLGLADLAIYVINHAHRPNTRWTKPIREELKPYVEWIQRVSWVGKREDGTTVASIFLTEDLRPKGE